jgi:GPH family glycoside/pentoside/hexuronide:cation symporter
VLTPARRVLYSLGTFGSSLLHQTVLLWVFYFYAPPPDQGLPARVAPGLLGLAIGLGRVVDALADPLVAHWSDGLRGRAGRRRPFILAGTPVLALVFALVWRPPDTAVTTANFAYAAVVLGIFYFVLTLVLNPYMALLPELTAEGGDRISTAAWQAVFSLSGTAIAYAASAQLSTRAGFPTMGAVLALAGMLPLLAAGLAVRERPVDGPPEALAPALRLVWGWRPFRIFIVGFALLWLGLSMVQLSLALVVTVLMGLPRAAVGTVLTASVVATIIATPVITMVAHRIGSHRTLLGAMTASGLVLLLMAAIGRWPVPLSVAAQGYSLMALAGPVLAALFTLPNAILADITEAVARERGRRVEGMFFAFQGLILNGATSVSAALLGLILSGFGYALGLRATALVALACVIAALAVFRRFPAEGTGRLSGSGDIHPHNG